MQRPVSFDRVASEYDATRALPPSLQAFAVEMIRAEVGSLALLDVGVGTGRLGVPLQEAGVRLTGCDISTPMLQVARSKGMRRLCRADVRRLPFRPGTFQRAMSNHLLHLIREWPWVLSEIARVTDGRYLSVLEVETEIPSLQEEYHRIAAGRGVLRAHRGVHERDLVTRLVPDRTVSSEVLRSERPADEELALLDRRLFSSQWDVPEPVHHDAVDALRERYGGSTLRSELRVDVVAWEVPRIAAWARVRADEMATAPAP